MEAIEKLQMRNVTRRFGSTVALRNFNLEIAGGTFVTLLGPSGCGKSTALNCLAGLLELSEGEILLNNKPIQHVPAEKRGFGMVFQSYALFPHLSVARNVSYGLEIRKVPKTTREKKVREALELVHLEQFANRYPAQLSGGQQQRLALARTIVLAPGLLLLDEPLSNLDANLRNEMRIEIKRIHNQLGLTTVYVTHDQSEAMSLSDKVVVMQQGDIEQVGLPQEIYYSPQSLYVARFMGYANRLSVELVERDQEGENWWIVKNESGDTLRASTTHPESQQWQPGQQVIACFRADETLAQPAPDVPKPNTMRGHVQLTEYMGRSFESLVILDGTEEEIRLLVHSPLALERGTLVEFKVAPERLLLFSGNETPVYGKTETTGTAEPVLKGRE